MENGWGEHKALVLHELKRLSDCIEDLNAQNRRDHEKVVVELSKINVEISAIKVKSGFYGALSGLGAGIAVFLAQFFGGGGGAH